MFFGLRNAAAKAGSRFLNIREGQWHEESPGATSHAAAAPFVGEIWPTPSQVNAQNLAAAEAPSAAHTACRTL